MKKDIRGSVKEFYSNAAVEPKGFLCCATSYDESEVAHIPRDTLDISYGCGSPVHATGLVEGETLLDLGSGGGVDCFIAAKTVGPGGKVYGVDMTDEMLERARKAADAVAKNLGYGVVEFRKGFLEEVPVDDSTADVVTSNCVLNLSKDKGKVFKEIYRVLKYRGRFCISDIVSDREVPVNIRSDKKLWGECIAGAMKEEDFLAAARVAGFYGLEVVNRFLYREIDGLRFNSITLKGYKLTKGPECVYKGHYAVYKGPFSSATDDDGHTYPVGVPVEICTDTLAKLTTLPYRGLFSIIEPDGDLKDPEPCAPGNCC